MKLIVAKPSWKREINELLIVSSARGPLLLEPPLFQNVYVYS